jgi:hypothetical protein
VERSVSGIFGGQTISNSETKIEALKLQSSAYGVTIPLVYGVTRIPGNLLWYGGFAAIPHTEESGGKGGGVTVTNTTFTYTASVMMGLCEGPVTGVSRVWRGKVIYDGGISAGNIVTATHNITMTSSNQTTVVTNAANFLAPISVTTMAVDEWGGTTYYPRQLTDGVDYTSNGGTYVFSNTTVNLDPNANTSIKYQYQGSNQSQSALAELGLSFKSGRPAQSVWSYLSTNYPDEAIGYSGLAYVYASDYSLGTGAQVENHTFEIQGWQAYSIDANVPDANPAIIAQDVITNGRYGAGFPASMLGDMSDWADYCLSGGLLFSPALTEQTECSEFINKMAMLTNTGPVWSGGRLKMIPFGDANQTANGANFTANTTPIVDLTDDDFITDGQDDPPIKITRKRQADAYNHVRVEFLNRGTWNATANSFSGSYNIEIAEAKDFAAIDAFGIRTFDTVQAHWICDAKVARNVAQLILQRVLFIRNQYHFSLAWTRDYLEPMDLVTLTDSTLGLSELPVRLISVQEGDESAEYVAEEFPLGVASASLYSSQGSAGFQHDYSADPGACEDPVVFELPGELTTTGLELGIAVVGLGANWGGCEVWGSFDDVTYQKFGTIYGGSRYGELTGPISGGNVPVVIKSGSLTSASSAQANLKATLCFIGGSDPEYVAYETANLTSNLHYTLTNLRLGLYSTVTDAHAANVTFVRVDQSIVKSGPLDPTLAGTPIYIKVPAFNIYGAAKQSLADVSSHTHTITGQFSIRDADTNWDFSLGKIGWKNISSSVSGDTTASGGRYGIVTEGSTAVAYGKPMPVDTSRVYRVRARVRRPSGSGGTFYAGVVCFDANGSVILNSGGGQHPYSAADSANVPVDSNWHAYEGRITGNFNVPSASPNYEKFWTSTVRAAPMIRMTGTWNGPLHVDFVTVDDITESESGEGVRLTKNSNPTLVKIRSTTIRKLRSSGAYDTDVISVDGYTGGAFASAVIPEIPGIFGLTTNPGSNGHHDNINFALFANESTGNIVVYNSGTNIGTASTSFDVGDVIAVAYDGSLVKYLQNGNVIYSQAATANLKLFFQCSMLDLDEGYDNIKFGPMSGNDWASVGGNKPIQHRLVAIGSNASNYPSGTVGLVNIDTGNTVKTSAASYNLVVFDKATGIVSTTATYNIAGNTSLSANLAANLNAVTANQMVVLWTHSDASTGRLLNSLPDAIYNCGGSPGVFRRSGFRGSGVYALVGQGNLGQGNGFEIYKGNVTNDPKAWADVTFTLQNGHIGVGKSGSQPEIQTDAIESNAATEVYSLTSTKARLTASDLQVYDYVTFTPTSNATLELSAVFSASANAHLDAGWIGAGLFVTASTNLDHDFDPFPVFFNTSLVQYGAALYPKPTDTLVDCSLIDTFGIVGGSEQVAGLYAEGNPLYGNGDLYCSIFGDTSSTSNVVIRATLIKK